MGCGGSKATSVIPAEVMQPAEDLKKASLTDSSAQRGHRDTKSGKSTASTDSGIADTNETDASSTPSPDSRKGSKELGAADTPSKAKSGCAFEINLDATPTPKKVPARLQALTQKPKRELTMLELDRQQREANKRRKEQLESVHRKAADEGRKVETVQSKLGREKTSLGESVDAKENRVVENRQRHLENLRNKLKAQDEKASKVRQNRNSGEASRSSVERVSMSSNGNIRS